jgi:hypothetical protein
MKTIEQCKNEIAIVNNFDSFKKAIRYTFNRELLESEEVFINKIIGEAMEQYAQEQVKNLTIPVVTASCCPKCGAPEVEAMTPRTKYKCGSSDYDQRPNTFKQTMRCKLHALFNWR